MGKGPRWSEGVFELGCTGEYVFQPSTLCGQCHVVTEIDKVPSGTQCGVTFRLIVCMCLPSRVLHKNLAWPATLWITIHFVDIQIFYFLLLYFAAYCLFISLSFTASVKWEERLNREVYLVTFQCSGRKRAYLCSCCLCFQRQLKVDCSRALQANQSF